ncbi:MAG: portal protein [Rhizobiaceae bacterium]
MDIARRRARAKTIWGKKAPFESIVRECFDYFMPHRRPANTSGSSKTIKPPIEIFDMTGPNSARHFPGELKRLVIPDGQPFILRSGPLIASKLAPDERVKWDLKLSSTAAAVYPFFQAGGFDAALHEAFTDLAVTNAYVMPVRGPSIEEPLFFVCMPTDQVAVQWDGYGRLSVLIWRMMVTREQLMSKWSKGKYSDAFKKLATDEPDQEVTLHQEFERVDGERGWRMVVYLESEEGEIHTETTKTQPVAAIRFYTTPGQDYSLGPVPFTLPTVRTQNTAQKLALKAFAIQLLGMWGYRSGGTFNPDTVRLAPGEFLPMDSTGGIMGPDVVRLDAATGRIDLARMLLENGKQQIRDALLDTRITDDGGTPASASEIAAKIRQNANTHIGAFGNVISDTLPVLVPRAMEILADWRILPETISFNQLLLSMEVASPMARASRMAEFEASGQYLQFIMQLYADDPGQIDQEINRQEMAMLGRETLLLPARLVPTEDQKKAAAEKSAQAREASMMAEMATKAAPQLAAALTQPEAQAA